MTGRGQRMLVSSAMIIGVGVLLMKFATPDADEVLQVSFDKATRANSCRFWCLCCFLGGLCGVHRVCVCVFEDVCERACVCVCVCVSDRQTDSQTHTDRQSVRQTLTHTCTQHACLHTPLSLFSLFLFPFCFFVCRTCRTTSENEKPRGFPPLTPTTWP